LSELQIMGPNENIPAPATPMEMIGRAVASGASVETMEKLLALQERWEANEARKSFVSAIAAFKANPPAILRNRHVEFETRGGGKTSYSHATLDNVCDAIGASLASHGLSWRWETEHLDQGIIRVTCILTHVGGHSERTALQASPDASGGKNPVQAVGSTVTYLQRYTLLAATGIAVQGQDDDAATAMGAKSISMDQVAEIQDGLAEVNADVAAFCAWLRVGSLAEITEAQFPAAMNAISAKRKKMGAAE
jgi:hypothetical protein